MDLLCNEPMDDLGEKRTNEIGIESGVFRPDPSLGNHGAHSLGRGYAFFGWLEGSGGFYISKPSSQGGYDLPVNRIDFKTDVVQTGASFGQLLNGLHWQDRFLLHS